MAATAPARPESLPWRSLLTREAQCCRICHDMGIRPAIALVPFADNLGLHRNHRGSFVAKRKAALKRHIEAAHPTWAPAVRWS